jgi:hypothetical protein
MHTLLVDTADAQLMAGEQADQCRSSRNLSE